MPIYHHPLWQSHFALWVIPQNWPTAISRQHFSTVCNHVSFPYLLLRCKGASHYGLTKERKRRSQDCSPDRSSSLAVAALGPELSAAAAIALMTDEPGLVNPAFSPTSEDSQSGSGPRDLHCSNRNRSKDPKGWFGSLAASSSICFLWNTCWWRMLGF